MLWNPEQIAPQNDFVLIERLEFKIELPGGLVAPVQSEDRQPIFRVLAVGPDVKKHRPGETVIMAASIGRVKDSTYVLVTGKELGLVRQEHIAARVLPRSEEVAS